MPLSFCGELCGCAFFVVITVVLYALCAEKELSLYTDIYSLYISTKPGGIIIIIVIINS